MDLARVGPRADHTAGKSAKVPMKKTLKTVDHVFVRGAALSPAQQLLVWIEGQHRDHEPRLIRLPVILERGQVGFSLHAARIGTAADAPAIEIRDAALGVGLGD